MLVVEHTTGPSAVPYAISSVYQRSNNAGHGGSGIQAVGYEGFEEGEEEQQGEDAGMVKAVSTVLLIQKFTHTLGSWRPVSSRQFVHKHYPPSSHYLWCNILHLHQCCASLLSTISFSSLSHPLSLLSLTWRNQKN